MNNRKLEDIESVSHRTLIDRNRALEDEVQNLKARLAEAEELQRAISEGDLDALVIPRPEGELVFTLDSADHAYRVLVETMNEGTATLAFDGTILYCNRRFVELLRMQSQDILGKSIYRFIEPEDSTTFKDLLERKKDSSEVNLHAAGGKSIPVYLSINSMQADDSQNAWCIVVTDLTDITEHMKNEEALKKANEEIQAQSKKLLAQNEELKALSEKLQEYREDLQCQLDEILEVNDALWESEQQLQEIIDGSPDTISVKDLSGRYILINKRLEEFVGMIRQNIKGKTDYDIFSPEWAEYYRKHDSKVIETGLPEQTEEVSDQVDGLHVFLANRFLLYDSKGKPYAICCFTTDITERKRADEALKKAYNTLEEKVKERTADLEKAYNSLKESEKNLAEAQRIAHIGSWEWDIQTGELHWSDEVYRIFGCNPQEFGANYGAFLSSVHPVDREYVNNAVLDALKNIKPYNIDRRVKLANGDERIVHEQGKVTFDEKNNPIRMIGTVQDITERKKAEEALAKIDIARKQEIHHRIKNNLQVISSLLDLQAEQFIDKECIKDSEVLEAFRESQARVISMALIHEELYKGGRFDTLNFSQYIEELAESLFHTYSIGNNDISLKLDLAENAFFDMDIAVPLGIIVNELVSNSFKHAFADRNKGEIHIKLSREYNGECINEECESTSFVLTTSDNGIGISKDLDIENLDSLGMQLVISLVEQLDGELELKRDNGTEFIIRFSVAESENQLSA